MAELVILNVPEDVLSRMRHLANKGDEGAQHWLNVELWKDYALLSPASYVMGMFIR